MDIQYASTAWNDIKHTKGWFGKICLLSLISLIPIFGQIVFLGYLFTWAREIAWGIHKPMGEKIFANEDGALYRRGFYLFVIGLAYAAISWAGSMILAVTVIGPIILTILIIPFQSVSSLRTTIYDDLGAGFQFKKIWEMIKYDTNGLIRIFGMVLLFGFIIGFVSTMAMFLALGPVIFSLSANGFESPTIFASSFSVVIFLVVMFLSLVGSVFIYVMGTRALGYWLYQFNLPEWGGKNDPMPFERGQYQSHWTSHAPGANYYNQQTQSSVVVQAAPVSSPEEPTVQTVATEQTPAVAEQTPAAVPQSEQAQVETVAEPQASSEEVSAPKEVLLEADCVESSAEASEPCATDDSQEVENK